MMSATLSAPLPRSPTKRDYLSWSAISTYRTCPLKYFFRYVAGLPDETVSASLVFGAAIHRAVEHHYRRLLAGETPPSLDELLQEYTREWQHRGGQEVRYSASESATSLDEAARRLIAHFHASDLAQPVGRVLAIEEDLRGSIDATLPDLFGKVDLICETDTELVITDWKTSRSRWSEQQVDDASEQLLLYAELAHDFAPGKQLRVELVVLTKTKEPHIDRHSMLAEPHRLDRTKRIVARVWRAIEARHYYPAPSPMNCAGCPYREPCRSWPG